MNENKFIIPLSIIVAAALIGGAIIYTKMMPSQSTAPMITNTETITFPPVSEKDHILGKRDAKVMLIEYSDTECPFCQRFHTTMHRLFEKYSADNSIAWVYRHFAIAQLHPKAPKEAEATECVAKLGGEEKFWKYLDTIYENTPSNNGLDHANLSIWAVELGIDKTAFESCVNSGEFSAQIAAAFNEARNIGAQGTPYTIIKSTSPVSAGTIKNLNDLFTVAATQMQVTPDRLGTVTKDGTVVLNGALPYEFIDQIIKVLVQK